MTIYENIKEIAKAHGMNLKEVANKAGIGENSIYRWQTSEPSMASLRKVADALHVSVDDLTQSSKDDTPVYRAIQRKAKDLTPDDQKKLLQIMKAAFGDNYDE